MFGIKIEPKSVCFIETVADLEPNLHSMLRSSPRDENADKAPSFNVAAQSQQGD